MIKRIGIFDSGVGGLSVLNALKDLPIPEMIYLADSANLPYGEKSHEQIIQFSTNAVAYLQSRNVDMVILACHTAATVASSALAQRFPQLPIINVADPAVTASITSPYARIGVIATPATIASQVHKTKILAQAPHATVITQACPKLAPSIEAGAPAADIYEAVEEYIGPMLKENIDTLIIGCTHYELIKEQIARCAQNITLISAPELIRNLITPYVSDAITISNKSIEYVATGDPVQFQNNVKRLFGWHIKPMTQQLSKESFTTIAR